MDTIKPFISIVSPVYMGEYMVDELVEKIILNVSEITDDFEIILVEDGSPDNSWIEIEKKCNLDKRVIGIELSRNFGQHYAISAGLARSKGEWVFVMDCDLQDRPEEIINLFSKAKEGFDIVLASRADRNDTFIKKYFSRFYYLVLSYLIGKKIDHTIANFGIYHRTVINNICKITENGRFFPMIVSWAGFKQTKIAIEHSKRELGKSNYTFKKLFNLGLTIVLSNSEKPIKIIIKIGFLISTLSFIFSIFQFFQYLSGAIKVLGYTSLFISICFFSGLILMTLGILGLYIGKIFIEVKNRPIYIIRQEIN